VEAGVAVARPEAGRRLARLAGRLGRLRVVPAVARGALAVAAAAGRQHDELPAAEQTLLGLREKLEDGPRPSIAYGPGFE